MFEVKTYVHDTAINIAELFEPKEPCAMCGIIEGVRLLPISSFGCGEVVSRRVDLPWSHR